MLVDATEVRREKGRESTSSCKKPSVSMGDARGRVEFSRTSTAAAQASRPRVSCAYPPATSLVSFPVALVFVSVSLSPLRSPSALPTLFLHTNALPSRFCGSAVLQNHGRGPSTIQTPAAACSLDIWG